MSLPLYGYVAGSHLFAQSNLSDAAAGAILLVLALVILCLCLFFIVKILHSMLKGKMAKVIKKVIMGMLTRRDPVTYIYLGELDHLWFSWWLAGFFNTKPWFKPLFIAYLQPIEIFGTKFCEIFMKMQKIVFV